MASIYDKASLVLIPSGTKTSKVYSQKPTNGDGDFTFSRSTAATRVNASGNIEKERTNYVRWSQDLTNWAAFGGTTLTTGVTDPNGGSNAATISNIGAGSLNQGAYLVNNPMTIGAGNVVCQSMYLKGSGTIAIAIERAIAGTYWIYHKVVTLTSEWQRFEQFVQIPTAASGFTFYVINASGTTATSVDIAFAQLEFGTAATDFIVTNGSAVTTGITDNVPRLDYTDSSCPALLLEPQRTNIINQSEYFGASDWVIQDVSLTANSVTSPEGVQNATTLTEDVTNQRHRIYYYINTISGTDYTLSVFVKKNSSGRFLLLNANSAFNARAVVNLDTLEITNINGTDAKIEDYGNGWYKFSISGQATISSSQPIFVQIQNAASDVSYLGDGSSLYLYGAQLEAGSYATSYIPTYGSAVTRNKEICEVTSAADLIGQTEGTIAGEFTFDSKENTNRLFSISGANWNQVGSIRFDIISLKPQATIRAAGGEPAKIIGTQDINVGSLVRFAVVYTSTTLKMFVNGVQIGSTATLSGSLPSPIDEIRVNALGGEFVSDTQNNQLNPYKQALVFKTALTDQEAIDLTTI